MSAQTETAEYTLQRRVHYAVTQSSLPAQYKELIKELWTKLCESSLLQDCESLLLQEQDNAMFDLEDNVPIPKTTPQGGQEIYPWRRMIAGQSFFLPSTRTSPESASALVSSANKRVGKGEKIFTWARVKNADGEIIGVRIWRTK
ncbi:MAG: hypothetical protein KGL39_54440 [Patescibacteria group bacterium]|nr:hypothetical protein [Patescibacteria group bacterium]